LVYPQKREEVFWASFIEIGKLDADLLLVILLYEDWVGEPVRVKCLSDEAGSE